MMPAERKDRVQEVFKAELNKKCKCLVSSLHTKQVIWLFKYGPRAICSVFAQHALQRNLRPLKWCAIERSYKKTKIESLDCIMLPLITVSWRDFIKTNNFSTGQEMIMREARGTEEVRMVGEELMSVRSVQTH